jgi:hypothetical protein
MQSHLKSILQHNVILKQNENVNFETNADYLNLRIAKGLISS